MSYKSIDAVQEAWSKTVFSSRNDKRKAAGRALGTLLELITYYMLNDIGLTQNLAIERALPEYANPEITHNVEFTLHTSRRLGSVSLVGPYAAGITPRKIISELDLSCESCRIRSVNPYGHGIIRNATTILESSEYFINAYVDVPTKSVEVYQLNSDPFAMIECKRVGVERGSRRGPQTIEKAKQGAYVALAASRIQRFRKRDGSIYGIYEKADGSLRTGPYERLLHDVMHDDEASNRKGVVLTIGVVSDHGNWFTSDTMNKELKVLAQSYDWLLFLSDDGFTQFINDTLFSQDGLTAPIREAFITCYGGKRTDGRFTKKELPADADVALRTYFMENRDTIQSWFNVLTPAHATICKLFEELKFQSTNQKGSMQA